VTKQVFQAAMSGGHGLGLFMAIIFLAGEMAGVGVLALPRSMVGTGPAGFALLVYFTINAMFVGTRLGLCWIMITERFPEFKEGCRDPYMVIAEKAVGPIGRHVVSVCVAITLYGSCCVVIVLMGGFLQNIFEYFDVKLTICVWMIIVAAVMTPLCWFGTPADFWFIAVGALVSTVVGCGIIMVKEGMDSADEKSCYYVYNLITNETEFEVTRPAPSSPFDFGKAFSSIMFAFAGASTFPTIQADMKDKNQFPKAAVVAMLILCMIYVPMSAVGWGLLGDKLENSVIDSLCDGPVKVAVEILFLVHLISAFPILLNPPSQFFEGLLKIPSNFGPFRVLFRTLVIAFLLILGLSLPDFGAILDLIGSTTITGLNFVFPPVFYMFLADKAKQNKEWTQRPVSLPVRIYCWHMVIVGIAGGVIAFINAVTNIREALSGGESCWETLFTR